MDSSHDDAMLLEEELTIFLEETNEVVEYFASHSFVTAFYEEKVVVKAQVVGVAPIELNKLR